MLILMDNGSLEPAATLALRELAARLAARLGEPVAPVSLLHSGKVPAEHLGGVPADTLGPFIARRAAAGVLDFRILPLFFGPSLALTEYLPGRVAELTAKHPGLRVRVAPCLCADEPGEDAVARMLADRVLGAAPCGVLRGAGVVLCDHGSPAREVTAVRDRLAARLRALLPGAGAVGAASMERREGPEYDFNEPLLATALRRPPFDAGEVIVAMQFLQPGRHAGDGGDVSGICAAAEAERPALRTRRTALLGTHPALPALLARRAESV